MFKPVLEKAEEPEIKLPASVGSSKKQQNSKKTIYFCFIEYVKVFDYVDHNELWKILQEMGIADHLTCILRSLYAGQEATVRTGHGTMNWFQVGKGVCQGVSCKIPDWMKHKLKSILLGEISAVSDMQVIPPLWQKMKRN